MLNNDVIECIISFLTFQEYQQTKLAHTHFHSKRMDRKKRFSWCKMRALVSRPIKQGKCSVGNCKQQKVHCYMVCIPMTYVLSVYCGTCTQKYKNINPTLLF